MFFLFSSITSITIYVNYHADKEFDSDRRRDRRVIVVIEERFLTTISRYFKKNLDVLPPKSIHHSPITMQNIVDCIMTLNHLLGIYSFFCCTFLVMSSLFTIFVPEL